LSETSLRSLVKEAENTEAFAEKTLRKNYCDALHLQTKSSAETRDLSLPTQQVAGISPYGWIISFLQSSLDGERFDFDLACEQEKFHVQDCLQGFARGDIPLQL
jgi:hypothetical protein